MATLAEMLRQGADRLVNLPSEAQRFVTNPQAFTQLVTGKNPMPRETGFAAGATGLPAQEMSVLDPNQAPYMQGYSQGEPVGYAGMAAPFAAPAAVATAKALAPKLEQVTENYMVRQGMIQPLTAYHGTPHTIQGQFDINKVGTGEGAQAYGHGMYFAENPAVAKQYALTVPKTVDSEAYSAENIAKRLYQGGFDENYITKRLKLFYPKAKEEVITNALESAKTGKVGGNVYKVDIPDADIPLMLDYDKPLTQQSSEVRKALAQYMDGSDTFISPVKGSMYNPTGKQIYEAITKDTDAFSGKGSKIASEQLNQLGIKGIRYLDEGSRKEGKGTSNFVVFEPSQVKILEQNNKPVTRKELIQEQINKIE